MFLEQLTNCLNDHNVDFIRIELQFVPRQTDKNRR